MLRLAFALIVLTHAVIHLLGLAKAFGWASPLQHAISRPVGILWALAAVLFGASALLLAIHSRSWWLVAAPALLLSQSLIVLSFSDAKFGTIANLVILVGVVVAAVGASDSSFPSVYQREVERRLLEVSDSSPIRAEDLAHLPPAVRRYLLVAGVVGQSRVQNFRARLRGEIRRNLNADFMPFEAEQHNFYGPPARLFLLQSALFGVPMDALHLYLDANASMQVRVASLFQVVDARGREMNQSETVTLFNDMCVLAPATLIDPDIAWVELEARSVRGTLRNAASSVSAVLFFDDRGELENFVSDDRFLSSDGKAYTKLRWSTPLRSYRNFGNVRLASQGEASWATDDGEFTYARLEVLSVDYNVTLARTMKAVRLP